MLIHVSKGAPEHIFQGTFLEHLVLGSIWSSGDLLWIWPPEIILTTLLRDFKHLWWNIALEIAIYKSWAILLICQHGRQLGQRRQRNEPLDQYKIKLTTKSFNWVVDTRQRLNCFREGLSYWYVICNNCIKFQRDSLLFLFGVNSHWFSFIV